MKRIALTCCDQFRLLDLTKMELPVDHIVVDWGDHSLWTAAAWIIMLPIYWIVVSRLEYRTRCLSRCCCSSHVACTLFAFSLLGLGFWRSWWFRLAVTTQPHYGHLKENWILWTGHAMVIFGTFLVIKTFLALGFYGTFLGDHFGIYLPRKVTDFPFTWFEHPMYVGASLNFLGAALGAASHAGLFLAFLAILMYIIASMFETPIMKQIYAERDRRRRTRTVGVQVNSQQVTVEIPARTVSTQGPLVEVQEECPPWQGVEIIEEDTGDAAADDTDHVTPPSEQEEQQSQPQQKKNTTPGSSKKKKTA